MSRKLIKRAICVIVSLIMTASLVSCGGTDDGTVTSGDIGSDTKTVTDLSVALVRDPPSYAYATENESVSSALNSFAKENGFTFSEFTVDDPDTESRLESFNTAITLGANVIVCVGRYMQNAVMTAQDRFPETSFLVVAGEEPGADDEVKFSENSHCIVFREEDAGYVAGYIAVREGSRAPAFYALSELSASIHCLGGFVCGVSDAAKEIGADDVKVICSINNDTMLLGNGGLETGDDGEIKLSAYTPSDLFGHGADHIVAMGTQVDISAEPSSLNGTKVTPVCFEADDVYGVFTEYPFYDCGPVAVKALGRLVSNGGKWSVRDAGTCGREGLAEDGITLIFPKGDDTPFGTEDLEKLKDKARKGEIHVPLCEDREDILSDGVTIIYIG